MRLYSLAAVSLCSALLANATAAAQEPGAFGTCKPRSQRVGREVGCFIVTEAKVGELGAGPVYWHVTRLDARSASSLAVDSSVSGTVIDAYGRRWLLTIGDSGWRAPIGTHVAAIGPLPVSPGVTYSALYMEASMRPGMKSMIHRHSGAEAWYTMSGETCLETPDGTQVGRRAAPPVIVPGGVPMELTATGSTLRTSLVLILHDSSRPPTTMETGWKPRGLCKLRLEHRS